jgi:hypothetical protein
MYSQNTAMAHLEVDGDGRIKCQIKHINSSGRYHVTITNWLLNKLPMVISEFMW